MIFNVQAMPIYRLIDELIFPPAELAEPDGLLAVGGDLGTERLLLAYRRGIFPWYSEGDPILWWSPEPRLIIEPGFVHVSKSLTKIIKQRLFEIKFDTAFRTVINNCANIPRKDGRGTWITKEMKNAYIRLHHLGYAHSVEAWQGERLAGGLYGISLGRAFFGESMFFKVSNASKIALIALANILEKWNFNMIDCQVSTKHLMNMGAYEIDRREFLQRLNYAMRFPTRQGLWTGLEWKPPW